MYKTSARVPFIDGAAIAAAEAAIPYIHLAVNIPLIATETQAAEAASRMVDGRLEKYEFIREIETIDLDTEKRLWTVNFIISGD